MPVFEPRNKKSAICVNANGTSDTRLTLLAAVSGTDTLWVYYIIVNPFRQCRNSCCSSKVWEWEIAILLCSAVKDDFKQDMQLAQKHRNPHRSQSIDKRTRAAGF